MAANVMYYTMGDPGVGSPIRFPGNPNENGLFQNANIFETKIGAKKKCINSMEQMAQRSPMPNLGRKCLFGREIRLRM